MQSWIAWRSWLTEGAPSTWPSLSRYRRQDTLASWPGWANGSVPSTRIVGEPCIPRRTASVFVGDRLAADQYVAAAFEHLRQAVPQQLHVRAVRHREHRQIQLELSLCAAPEAPDVRPGLACQAGCGGRCHPRLVRVSSRNPAAGRNAR